MTDQRCEATHMNETIVAIYDGVQPIHGPAEVGVERCDREAGHGGAHSSESETLVSIWSDEGTP